MRWFLSLVVFTLLIGFASALVTIHNATLQKTYFSGDQIVGSANLTIKALNFNSFITSNKGDKITLETFLDANGVEYTCNPKDCSNGYSSKSNSSNILLKVDSGNDSYFGFYIKGKDVSINSFNLSISSDFGNGDKLPLELTFFESDTWQFSKFSNVFSPKYWGCYNSSSKTSGPLIRTSSYCEMISLKETAIIRAGADIEKLDTKDLRMSVYPEDGGSLIGSCTFDPNQKDYCDVSAEGSIFGEGKYQVCVSADTSTNYKVYNEATGPSCGFAYASGPSSSTKDYAIYAQTARYENATALKPNEMINSELASKADDLIQSKYSGNCTLGCFLPIRVSGISQNLNISSLTLGLVANGEDLVETKIHKLDMVPSTVDFFGVLDLSLTSFLAKTSGIYQISISNKSIVSENLNIIPSPVVEYISPMDPPAGIPVTFTAGVNYVGGDLNTLKYEWDFGDGSPKENSNTASLTHTYSNIGQFSLNLVVSSNNGNISSQKSFLINTVTPKEAVNLTFALKKKQLDDISKKINSLPGWYVNEVKKKVDLDSFSYELERIDGEIKNAAGDDSYVLIAKDLYALDIPLDLKVDTKLGVGLIDNPALFNLFPVASYAGGVSLDNLADYNQQVFNWQGMYVLSAISSDQITLKKQSGTTALMSVYSIDIVQKDVSGEAYLVIDKQRSEISFEGDTVVNPSEGSTLVILNPNEWKSVKFYYDGNEPVTIYVAPKLSNIVLEDRIVEDCNFNFVCEDGETWKTCRSDCKPTTLANTYYIIVFLVAIVLYILLQRWYANKYESFLFGDKSQLFNLLMYIYNARARGMNDSKIDQELRAQGWSAEKITFAIRKSEGKSTGLPEIIPFSRFRALKLKKQVQMNTANATANQGNIQNRY